jgi:uncharacterized protein (DUF433 family)
MGDTSGNAALIMPSFSSKKTHRFDPPHETLRHGEAGALENFETFAESLRRELTPLGLMESLVADRAILAAWRLHAATRAESDALRKSSRSPRSPRLRSAASAEAAIDLDREARRLEEALDLLEKLRDRRLAPLDIEPAPIAIDDFIPTDLSNEWPVLPIDATADFLDGEPEADDEPQERWQDRLVFDDNVSASSPVVKGTWVTVGHVVSLIVDGWTWGDILRTHPELTEDDIRICLAYTIAQDNGEADA